MSIPRVGPYTLFIQAQVPRHYPGWVAPFGNPRITANGSSPGLIAASHVLHRLWAPRHPPCTLCSLTATPPSLTEGSVPLLLWTLNLSRRAREYARRWSTIHLVKERLGLGAAMSHSPQERSILYASAPICQARFSRARGTAAGMLWALGSGHPRPDARRHCPEGESPLERTPPAGAVVHGLDSQGQEAYAGSRGRKT